MIAKELCPDCGSNDFILNRKKGEVICRKCSFVVDEALIDFGAETRSFDMESTEKNSVSSVSPW